MDEVNNGAFWNVYVALKTSRQHALELLLSPRKSLGWCLGGGGLVFKRPCFTYARTALLLYWCSTLCAQPTQ